MPTPFMKHGPESTSPNSGYSKRGARLFLRGVRTKADRRLGAKLVRPQFQVYTKLVFHPTAARCWRRPDKSKTSKKWWLPSFVAVQNPDWEICERATP